MPRHNDPRALPDGRVKEWRDRMAQRVRLADGTELDMLDPESIRDYVRRTLAMSVEPTSAALRRLEMMLEVADSLPQPETKSAAVVKLVDAKAAAEELQRRLNSK